MEDFLSRELRWTLDVALTMRPSDRLDDEDLSRIMMFVSLFVPHIVSRSPQSVDCAIANAPHVLEAMREAGIGSSESLREAYREAFPDEKLDATLVFDPRSLSEYVSLRLQMIPGGEAFESSRYAMRYTIWGLQPAGDDHFGRTSVHRPGRADPCSPARRMRSLVLSAELTGGGHARR